MSPGGRTRYGHEEDLCAADAEESAAGRAPGRNRQHRIHDTSCMQNFALAIGAGVLMVFAVLVLLFARVFQPITILSALPLSLGGAVLALLLTGMPFSLARDDRHPDAHGHRRQEFDPAGGFRHRGDARRQDPPRTPSSRRVTSGRGPSS